VNRVDVRQAITQAHHEEWARVVAALTRRFGDLDIAEEAARDAGSSEQSAQLRGCVRLETWRWALAAKRRPRTAVCPLG
jgi:predicted RNA polymerase sigma factor